MYGGLDADRYAERGEDARFDVSMTIAAAARHRARGGERLGFGGLGDDVIHKAFRLYQGT